MTLELFPWRALFPAQIVSHVLRENPENHKGVRLFAD
jgi:hypothetical protein